MSAPPEVCRLWLDDVRDPVRFGRIGWTWAKTYDEAIAILAGGNVVEASLDHDLSIGATLGQDDGEKTGYDVVCWMEEHGVWPEVLTIHTANPAGADRMMRVAFHSGPRTMKVERRMAAV